jgi:hypothetical protein
MPRIVSSMIALAMCQKPAGAIDLFRECIAVFLETRLEVKRTWSHAGHIAARDKVLDWFLRSDKPDHQRRRVLLSFLNADWSSGQPIHNHPPGCPCGCITLADFKRYCRDNISPSLAPCLIRLFPKHRWTKAEETVSDVGLLSSCHAILQQILPVWLRCLKGHRQPTPRDEPSV